MKQKAQHLLRTAALLVSVLAMAGCGECLVDSDCPGGLVCSVGEQCVECTSSRDCDAGERCRANLCVTSGCTSDAQCPLGFDCDAGECTQPGSSCGDLVCDVGESCSSCPSDCGSCGLCGDGRCDADESCSSCASDCGSCGACGDGVCGAGESCSSCSQDCGSCQPRTCADLPARVFSGTNACLPVPAQAQSVVNSLVSVWGTQPTFFCRYDPFFGTFGTACGLLPPGNAVYCGGDNSISYDARLLNQQLAQYGQFAPIAILAHEWGHMHQARAGLLGGGRSTFQNEQHADCQAGVFAAIAEELGWLGSTDVMSAFASLCSVSDPTWHPNGHGTCDQRVTAFGHGYATGRSVMGSVCAADPVQTALQICAN